MQDESKDRVALVTGAGSATGIGAAAAGILAREGASVALAATTDRIHERARELTALGRDAAGFVADLTDRDQAHAMVEAVLSRFGRLDILVNNAGMVNVGMQDPAGSAFVEMTDDEWLFHIALNLHTAYHVTRAALPGSERASYVTGSVVVVDGGNTIQETKVS